MIEEMTDGFRQGIKDALSGKRLLVEAEIMFKTILSCERQGLDCSAARGFRRDYIYGFSEAEYALWMNDEVDIIAAVTA